MEFALPDPSINTTTFLAPVQTAAGEQNFALGVTQKLTRRDRRATKAAIAADDIAWLAMAALCLQPVLVSGAY